MELDYEGSNQELEQIEVVDSLKPCYAHVGTDKSYGYHLNR